MLIIKTFLMFISLFCLLSFMSNAQDINTYRIINVTLDTSEPDKLQINHGKLIWKDKDPNSGTYNLKYFSGAEIFKLDSNLTGLTSAIDADYIAWNSSSQEIKVFNVKDWSTSLVGSSYNPDSNQPISLANGKLAFARSSGNGTEIVVKNLVTGQDTTFSTGVWNLEPSLHHGQLAWIQKFLSDTTSNNIYFFDGLTIRNLTGTSISKNYKPILKDGQVTWLQLFNNNYRTMFFDGDSIITLSEADEGSFISGYDLSNGIAVASVTDSSTNNTEIKIYNSETKSFTILNDTAKIHGLHIDNGLVCWSSGSGVQKKLMIYNIAAGITDEWGSAINPVIDDEQVAWTLGDGVSLLVPVTYLQLSSGNENGWAQSRFKNNDGEKVIWGNFDNSTNSRLFYSDGNSTVQLTDSLVYKDFIMINNGYSVWRHDFTSLYLYDGINPPQLIFDSLQCENMYLADASIGFHGFRSDAGNNINQAWLYRINEDNLIQLTNDTSDGITNTFTLVDEDYACWFRDSSNISMLMLYDGTSKTRLTESPVNNEFGFVDGKIVWSESINNVFQIMMYDVNGQIKMQITDGDNEKYKPITDGSKIVWFESAPEGTIIWYYDIASDKAHKVAHIIPPVARWLWLSNGKVAWSSNGEVFVYDGNIISQLTNIAPSNPNLEPYIDNDIVVWNKNNFEPNILHYGQIYRGKLHAHVSFDADNIVGLNPLTVSFKNNSFQGIQSYLWDFGDGQTSTEKNPIYIYQTPGIYSVALTVDGPAGSSSEKKINLIRVNRTTTVEELSSLFPKEFKLYQNYPNPFNPTTNFEFRIAEFGLVSLKVYDVLGREVATLVNEERPAGNYEIKFDAGKLASGIYIYQLKAGSFMDSKVFHLIK
jgi:hypothetical protein